MQKKKKIIKKTYKIQGLQAHCSSCTEAHAHTTIFLDFLGWQVRAVSLVADGPLSEWPRVWVLLLCPVDSEPTAPPGAGPVFY